MRSICPHFVSLFSTDTANAISEERARKLKALFGVTAATNGQKPVGTPTTKSTPLSVSASAFTSIEDKGEQQRDITEATTTATAATAAAIVLEKAAKESAEKAWLDSGYIEYMDHQRDKGWKS